MVIQFVNLVSTSSQEQSVYKKSV